MKVPRLLLLGLLGALGPVSPAAAVCPQPPPKVCGEFFKSEAVFTGTVVAQREVPPRGDIYAGWVYRLLVHEVFRGPRRQPIEVFTENSSGRMLLELDRDYLLFAHSGGQGLEITNCGNSGPVAERREQIRAIQELGAAPTLVEGNIASRSDWAGVAGVHVLVAGPRRTYSTVSDESGAFRVAVPPGTYSVRVQLPDVDPFDLSYDDPQRVSVQKGQCGQVQFVR